MKSLYYGSVWIDFQHHGPNKRHISLSLVETTKDGSVVRQHRKMMPCPELIPNEAEIVLELLPGAIHFTESIEEKS